MISCGFVPHDFSETTGTNVMAHEGQVGVKVWDKTTLFATYQYRDSLTTPGAPVHTLRTGIFQAF